jgi:hypothetical protein
MANVGGFGVEAELLVAVGEKTEGERSAVAKLVLIGDGNDALGDSDAFQGKPELEVSHRDAFVECDRRSVPPIANELVSDEELLPTIGGVEVHDVVRLTTTELRG